MDRVDAIPSVGEIPPHIDVTKLTPEESGAVRQYESLALETGTEGILNFIKLTTPNPGETIMEYVNYIPAFVLEHEGKLQVILNTDLVKDVGVRKIFKRHEAVEIVMSDKTLDPVDVAIQIGVDPGLIINDQYNNPAHYIAIYHQTLLAKEIGKTAEMISEFKSSLSTFLKGPLMEKAVVESQSSGLSVQQCFRYRRNELITLNLTALKQIVNEVAK